MSRPRFPGAQPDERAALTAFLGYLRDGIVDRLVGVDPVAARRSPVPSGTNLAWIGVHLALVEAFWFDHILAGGPMPDWNDRVDEDTRIEEVVDAYRAACARSDAAIAAHGDLGRPAVRPFGSETVTLGWILTHMTQETARHAGHADILRELIDGSTG